MKENFKVDDVKVDAGYFEDSNIFIISGLVYWLLAMYALSLAFKCNASWPNFAAACCCPPFYIAYVFISLGGC